MARPVRPGGGGGYGPGPSAGGIKRQKVTMTAANEKSMSWTKKPTTVGKMRLEPKEGGQGSRVVKDVPAKRRLGTIGKAQGKVKAKATKEIKQERKQSGESLYDKKYYGKKSVNAKMTKVPSRSRSGR